LPKNIKQKLIDDEKEIQEILQKIANDFPSTIRFPFKHRSGYLFNCAYSIMIGVKNKLLLYIADSTDKNRLEESEIHFENDQICLFSGISKNVYMFKLDRSSVNRITEKEAIRKKYIAAKYNFDSRVMSIEPALSIFKENLLNRHFVEFVEINFPTEIYEMTQRRASLRCPIPAKAPVYPVVLNGLPERSTVFNNVYLDKNAKAELTRYWNQATNEIKPLSKIILEFMNFFPNSIISFYFKLDELIGKETAAKLAQTKRVTQNYSSFSSIKNIILQKKQTLYSEPKFIIPLYIYGEIEGHVLFLNTSPEKKAYLRLAMFIFSKALERTKYFDIYSSKNVYLKDIGTNGLRFISTVEAHKRLQKDATFLMEFSLNWSTHKPIRVGVRVVDFSSSTNTTGQKEFDVKCTFEKALNFNENIIYRISKYVNDHINFTYK